MDIRQLAEENHMEEIERQLMDLDSKIQFQCRKYGKCCKHQHTIFSPLETSSTSPESFK